MKTTLLPTVKNGAAQRRFVIFGGVYLLTWLAAWHSAALLANAGGASLWFLPAGLRFFCLLFFGRPGFIVELTTQTVWVFQQLPIGDEVIIDFFSTRTLWQIYGWYVSLLVNAAIVFPVRWMMHEPWNLTRVSHCARFILSAAVASVLAGLAGSFGLLARDEIRVAQWFDVFVSWSLGDFIGVVTLTPWLMVRIWPRLSNYLKQGRWSRFSVEKAVGRSVNWQDDLKTFLITTSFTVVVFGLPWGLGLDADLPLLALLLLLPLAGVALRYGLRRSVVAVLVLDTGMVVLIALIGRIEQAFQYQWVMLAIALVGLWLGGSVEARSRMMSRYRDFADVSNDLFWETDRKGRLLLAGGHLARRLALNPGETWRELLDRHQGQSDALEAALSGRQTFRGLELHLANVDGGALWFQCNGLVLFDDAGEFKGFRGTANDCTTTRRAQKLLKDFNRELVQAVEEKTASLRRTVCDLENKERHLQVLLAAAPMGVVELDASGACRYMNTNGSALTGCAPDQALGLPLLELVHPEDREYVEFVWSINTRSSEVICLEFRLERTNQRCVAHWINLTHARQEIKGTIMVLSNADARSQQDERLWTLAHHDALTALPNRNLFRDRLEQALLHARRSAGGVALLWIDLDGFKAVNDRLGHAAGDALLLQVAQRLKARIRASDTVARIGGDEFAVVMPDTSSVEDAVQIAMELAAGLAESFALPDGVTQISGSIGVALYPLHAENAESLTQRADLAMYAAKRSGKNRVVVWDGVP